MTTLDLSEAMPVRTQFVFFTLLGDYVLPNGGKIWTSDLLELMGLLDVSERAVRSTLSRMTRKGWIKPKKHGRRSRYSITPRGRALLEAGYARIFEPTFTEWNQCWHMVVYSLPEKRRKRRHTLRKQLTWLGFGRLAPGTWISPHDRQNELKNLFDDLNIEPFVEQFSGVHLGPSSSADLAQRCWDLDELEKEYQAFYARYEPEYRYFLNQQKCGQLDDPQHLFVRRFWITHEFQALPLKDPNLPLELLPKNWIGTAAHQLLNDYRDLLGPAANRFVKQVINGAESERFQISGG